MKLHEVQALSGEGPLQPSAESLPGQGCRVPQHQNLPPPPPPGLSSSAGLPWAPELPFQQVLRISCQAWFLVLGTSPPDIHPGDRLLQPHSRGMSLTCPRSPCTSQLCSCCSISRSTFPAMSTLHLTYNTAHPSHLSLNSGKADSFRKSQIHSTLIITQGTFRKEMSGPKPRQSESQTWAGGSFAVLPAAFSPSVKPWRVCPSCPPGPPATRQPWGRGQHEGPRPCQGGD